MKSIRYGLSEMEWLKKGYYSVLGLLPPHAGYSLNRSLRSPYSKFEDEYNCIFIHIPKAAGNSVVKALGGSDGTGHDAIDSYYKNNKKKFDSYYKFSFVRNPWDRFVSAFYYLKQGGIGYFDGAFERKFLSDYDDVGSFVKAINESDELKRKVMSWIHFVPQVDFFSFLGDDNSFGLDFLGKFEELDEGLVEVASALGVNVTLSKNFNSSKRGCYRNYLNNSEAEIIESLYFRDVAAFGYRF